MHYYPPYYSYVPYYGSMNSAFKPSLFGKLKSIKWSSVLDNTNRVLNIANQAIPVVKQITPVMRNAKTMFQVMNEFKKVDPKPTKSESGPTFFA